MADLTTTPATLPRRPFSGRLVPAGSIAGLCIVAVVAGPYFLDSYTVNILVRSFLYAATALTVDILWGYTGILTFGQAAFFGIGAYAAGIIFTYMDFSPQTAGAGAGGRSRGISGRPRHNRLDIVLSRRLAALCRDRDAGAADHPRA